MFGNVYSADLIGDLNDENENVETLREGRAALQHSKHEVMLPTTPMTGTANRARQCAAKAPSAATGSGTATRLPASPWARSAATSAAAVVAVKAPRRMGMSIVRIVRVAEDWRGKGDVEQTKKSGLSS